MITEAVFNVSHEMFEVSSNLVYAHLQTLAKVLNSLYDCRLPRKLVPDLLQCGLKFRNR